MSKDDFAVHVDSGEKRADIPEFQDGPCPFCGGEQATSYGLAGGGFGVYTYCGECQRVTSKSIEDEG